MKISLNQPKTLSIISIALWLNKSIRFPIIQDVHLSPINFNKGILAFTTKNCVDKILLSEWRLSLNRSQKLPKSRKSVQKLFNAWNPIRSLIDARLNPVRSDALSKIYSQSRIFCRSIAITQRFSITNKFKQCV